MCRISIKNVGPIKHVDITLKKYTMLLGPQCSGKSTIAKILCHCQWAEKRCYTDFKKEKTFFEENNRFLSTLKEYHRMMDYFDDPNCYIHYEGNYVNILMKDGVSLITLTTSDEQRKYQYPKVCYVPAERNIVTAIPNLKKYNETNDNILYFMYDWFEAREYLKDFKLDDLFAHSLVYHFDENAESDYISDNGKKIQMANASSGVQSVVPLYAVFFYVLNSVYQRFKPLSPAQRMMVESLRSSLAEMRTQIPQLEDAAKRLRDDSIDPKEWEDLMQKKTVIEEMFRQVTENEDVLASSKRNFFYANTKIYVEEIEQNLFPDAQVRLLYWMIEQTKLSKRDDSLFLTTHSPYVLFALNNCMLGDLVKDKVHDREQLSSSRSWVNPLDVAVLEIHDGELKSIQDEDGLLDNNYLNKTYKRISNEFMTLLNSYGTEE